MSLSLRNPYAQKSGSAQKAVRTVNILEEEGRGRAGLEPSSQPWGKVPVSPVTARPGEAPAGDALARVLLGFPGAGRPGPCSLPRASPTHLPRPPSGVPPAQGSSLHLRGGQAGLNGMVPLRRASLRLRLFKGPLGGRQVVPERTGARGWFSAQEMPGLGWGEDGVLEGWGPLHRGILLGRCPW